MENQVDNHVTLTVQDVIVTPQVKFVAQPVQLELDLDIKESTDERES